MVPATRDPIITVDAPRDSAFTMVPADEIPPSAITGTSYRRAYSETWEESKYQTLSCLKAPLWRL